MINNNRAVEIFRQKFKIKQIRPENIRPYQCKMAANSLRQCLGTQKSALYIDESGCDQTDFKKACNGQWRRHFIEQTYRQQVANRLYTQKDLDAYSLEKNSIKNATLY